AYAGGYYFWDSRGDTIVGVSGRLQANIAYGLDTAVEVTNDNYFDTRAFVNVSWTFGPLRRSEMSQSTAEGRLGEHGTRNYTVLAPIWSQTDNGVLAIDPATNQPYTVAHVNSSAAVGGDGSAGSPFQTIAQAQSANRNIVWVAAGSTFSGANATIAMTNGENL